MFKYVSVTTDLSFYYFQLIELHGERERERERERDRERERERRLIT